VNPLRDGILNRQFRIGTLESQQVLRLKTGKDEDKRRLCLDIFFISIRWNKYQTSRSQSLIRPGANFLTGIEHQTLGTSFKSRVIVPEKKATRMQNCKGNREVCKASTQDKLYKPLLLGI
jgi:hypothetical protein